MFESKSGVLLVAGFGFFALAFLSNGVVPVLMYAHVPERTAEQEVNVNLLRQFYDMRDRYPDAFQKYVGELRPATYQDDIVPAAEIRDDPAKLKAYGEEKGHDVIRKCAESLRLGKHVYVGEGCWHCHSQFVRPVSNESRRWGPVAASWEYQNELQRPVMFGTRRVGPDLSREGGRRSNDWHVVHFYRPRMTSPESVMPDYPWFFDNLPDGPGTPNRRGFALLTYMQWLGSWLDSYPHYHTLDRPGDEP
jgi:hypothetical protein